MLKLRGKLLNPEISFEIQLAPEDKGILGGAVNQKLSQLNEDPSALNKQVFALLVLNRFIQENPFQTETGGTESIIRSTVSKFLSSQINRLSNKVLPGVDLNFDIQSYDDYQSGQAKGRTQVEIGVKKQLFNERLSVQIGGSVDVEGARASQNSASDITGDVTVEYKLTPDGRFRMKGFRHNQYEGAIEGQLVETGAGIVFVRDFNQWKRLFKKPPKSPNGGLKKALLNK
jgi:translocation and assembly module TamB